MGTAYPTLSFTATDSGIPCLGCRHTCVLERVRSGPSATANATAREVVLDRVPCGLGAHGRLPRVDLKTLGVEYTYSATIFTQVWCLGSSLAELD